jgi:hypothetical protein
MSEQATTEQETLDQANLPNPFSEQNWAEPEIKDSGSNEQFQPQQQQQEQQQEEADEEIYDANEYLKQKLGFDDWDTAASEIEQLKKSKDSSSLKFENEESRKYYEYAKEQKEDDLLAFLQEKKKIEKLANADIKDANTAAEIIKLSMYQKNKELEQDEIEFLFKEKFNIPEKPEQNYDELDSEYEQRVSKWESKVNEIEKRLVIEAKLAKPELEKIKSQLVLPEISPKQSTFTQEEIEAQKKYINDFFVSANEVVNSFDGFSATVKDEGVDFNVAYTPSQEERQIVTEQLREFAENNLDANVIFAQRWVNDDGTLNTKQMTKDLFLLQNEGKIAQKYVNDAANKRLAMHLKKQSNINLSSTNSGTFSPNGQQSEMDKLAAVMFAK